MRMLQALVIFMAVLIFIAMGFLVYGLMTRVDVVEDVVNPAPALTGKAFNDVNVTLPAGASVGWMTVADGRIVVHVAVDGGRDEIRLFELASGRPLGTIRFMPAP